MANGEVVQKGEGYKRSFSFVGLGKDIPIQAGATRFLCPHYRACAGCQRDTLGIMRNDWEVGLVKLFSKIATGLRKCS